ncbi:M3 family metallopeptidase [soil metagenome]
MPPATMTGRRRVSTLLLLTAAMACATTTPPVTDHAPATAASATANPLLAEWSGPFGGVPPFDRVEVAHFQPALEAAMAEQLAEIGRIAADPAPPSFENTLVPYERAGRTLNRVSTVYSIWGSTMNTPDFQAVQREMAPRLAAHSDQIIQNTALFRRIEAVYNAPDKPEWTSEQQRLSWIRYTNFVRAGARLDSGAKARVGAINQQLAGLFTRFNQNVLADETDQVLVITNEADLAGLPQSLRDAAATAATSKGRAGAWVITNTRSAMDPFLTYAENRALRERAWRMFVTRGDLGGETDNKAIISEILALRAERAKLLGFETHAHWRLENAMARTPERAMELMTAVWPAAVARVREEVADMQAIANAEGAGITIEPWDYRFYAEKVPKARFDLDESEIKPYMQLEKLREGMFWVAGELFGFRFEPVSVPVYHPDVRVWEVTDRTSGRHVGLWYFDPYARAGKRSGAWMNAYRQQGRVDGDVTTIVSNNSNFVKGNPGDPVLISWNDAETLFHEFGHALHGLSSNVTYPVLSGTAVARDYVEFPSQLLEHWLESPEVLQRFALHHQTGQPIPQELVERIQRASTFNQGFATVEYLISALMDMRLHLAGDTPIDPVAFERETLAELGMPREIVMRHRLPHFLHVFGSDGYSAGYYSYLWSDVLTADAAEAFREATGFYDPGVAQRLRQYIFSVGNTVDPAEGYRAFRGRDPQIGALMRKRGFLGVVDGGQ